MLKKSAVWANLNKIILKYIWKRVLFKFKSFLLTISVGEQYAYFTGNILLLNYL